MVMERTGVWLDAGFLLVLLDIGAKGERGKG